VLGAGVTGLRIATLGGYFGERGEPAAFDAVSRCAEALSETRSVTLPDAHRARAAAFLITMTEGAALHLDRLRTRADDFDPAVRDRLLAGALLPAAWAVQAQKLRRRFAEDAARLFETVDILLAPSTPCPAPKLGQAEMTVGGVTLPVRANLGIYTQPISCIGLPVAAVPVWLPGQDLPMGVQVIGPPWREDLVLRVAAALEAMGVAQAPVAPLD
jgi:1-carboxybiuret hydrolase